jgi:diguanylate cyclase (GGDEF)-like protein
MLSTLYVLFYLQKEGVVSRKKAIPIRNIMDLRNQLLDQFEVVRSDLLYVTEMAGLNQLIKTGDIPNRDFLISDLKVFSEHKKKYDQIRYIDETGMEKIRINLLHNKAVEITDNELQNKKDRYYFIEAMQFKKGEIYVSPFDLNMEQGKIEEPYKPMIRFATPVFDDVGKPRGIVIFNYLGQSILDKIENSDKKESESYALLNSAGYWLYDPEGLHQWGFMFEDKKHTTWGWRFPDLWEKVGKQDISQNDTKDQFISSVRIKPFGDLKFNGHTEDWILVSSLPASVINDEVDALQEVLVLLGWIISILSMIISLVLAQSIVKAKNAAEALQEAALHDSLTGLPNRNLFFDRIDKMWKQSVRYQRHFAIAFIDLDDFKEVNDTYGHDVGDLLLKELGRSFQEGVRASDTIARFGGDEFLAILDGVDDEVDAKIVARKLIAMATEDRNLKGHKIKIGVSVGLAVFSPDKGENVQDLLRRADEAMYAVKKTAKNGFEISL